MNKPVIIFGSGTLAMHALDIFKSHDITVYCFLDDDEKRHGEMIDDVSVLGAMNDHGFLKLIDKKAGAFVALEELDERERIVTMLLEDRKSMPMNAVHSSAWVSSSAVIGHGNFIAAGAVVQAFAKVDQFVQIFANATIGARAELADFVQIGQGASIGDGVILEEGVYIGAGATVIGGVKVGKNAKIGPGAVVISDVGEDEGLFGNPAQKWKKN